MRDMTPEEFELATEIIEKVTASFIGTTMVTDATMGRMRAELNLECAVRWAEGCAIAPDWKWDVRPVMAWSEYEQREVMTSALVARPVKINGEDIEWRP